MRNASSMLELVVAIVVMGIAIMTLPLMLTRIQHNNAFSMQQEAILAARTKMGDILTYPWDENSSNNNYVLDTNSTHFSRIDANSTRRIGHVIGNKRRKYSPTKLYATASVNLGPDVTDTIPNDIDDFNSTSTSQQDSGETAISGLDYKFDTNMTTTVGYVDDNYTIGNNFDLNTTILSSSTNIKMIEIQTIDTNNDINFTLRAYSTNIGQGELLRKDFN